MGLVERLDDPNERFSPEEVLQLIYNQPLADRLGLHREGYPRQNLLNRTGTITIPKFEKFGAIVVKVRQAQDLVLDVANLRDRLLGDNFNPSQGTSFNAFLLAYARVMIVAPTNLVDEILQSPLDTDLDFFPAFYKEHGEWMKAYEQEYLEKKYGQVTGSGSSSGYDTPTSSPQPTPDG